MDLFVPAKPPLGVQDKAAGPQNPGWLQGTANAVMRAQRGFRGDEQVHDTLQTLSDNRASPDRQKVVHAYREIAAWVSRSASLVLCGGSCAVVTAVVP